MEVNTDYVKTKRFIDIKIISKHVLQFTGNRRYCNHFLLYFAVHSLSNIKLRAAFGNGLTEIIVVYVKIAATIYAIYRYNFLCLEKLNKIYDLLRSLICAQEIIAAEFL